MLFQLLVSRWQPQVPHVAEPVVIPRAVIGYAGIRTLSESARKNNCTGCNESQDENEQT